MQPFQKCASEVYQGCDEECKKPVDPVEGLNQEQTACSLRILRVQEWLTAREPHNYDNVTNIVDLARFKSERHVLNQHLGEGLVNFLTRQAARLNHGLGESMK